MLTFIDESGDPGRKILNGSSTHFVVALVTFADNEDAQECDDRIRLLREEIGKPPGFEFHFSENSKKIRESFLDAVSPCQFFYHIFALNKDPGRPWGPGFNFKEDIYKFTARLTFENAKPYLIDAKVVIDKSGDKKFRDELAVYLRRRIKDSWNRSLIRSVKAQDSAGNNLIQLADYVASVNNRAINEKADGIELRRKYLAHHELTHQVWPK